MIAISFSRITLACSFAALAWWLYPTAPINEAETQATPAVQAGGVAPLPFSLASPVANIETAARTGNGLFGLDDKGALIFDARTAAQLAELARSLPRDLDERELLAIDEFAGVGLTEPEAAQARGIVRDYLAQQGIGLAPVSPPVLVDAAPATNSAVVSNVIPEVMPESLLATRPAQPEGVGLLRFPGMGDEPSQ